MTAILAWPGCAWSEVAPAAALLGPVRVLGAGPARVKDGYTVVRDGGWDGMAAAERLLVPGGELDAVWDDAALLAALRAFDGAIGAICNGALLLARAGLLVGRRCTHTAHAPYATRPEWAELLDHAEPALEGSTWVDEDVVVDGNVVTAKPWAAELFAQVFAAHTGVATPASTRPETWERWVIDLDQIPGVVTTREHVRDHVRHLRGLEAAGKLVLAGPFPEDRGGQIVLRVSGREEAERIMNADPFVARGVRRARLRRWLLSCAANGHLGGDS